MFEVTHVDNVERAELDAYQLKTVTITLFNQWKDGRDNGAPYPSWDFSKKPSWEGSFPENSRNQRFGSSSL